LQLATVEPVHAGDQPPWPIGTLAVLHDLDGVALAVDGDQPAERGGLVRVQKADPRGRLDLGRVERKHLGIGKEGRLSARIWSPLRRCGEPAARLASAAEGKELETSCETTSKRGSTPCRTCCWPTSSRPARACRAARRRRCASRNRCALAPWRARSA